jgi:hypothetical protein
MVVLDNLMWPIHRYMHSVTDALNNERWSDFIKSCCETRFNYKVVNYSPEIRKTQVWANRDYAVLRKSFDLLPRHNSDRSKLTRQIIIKNVELSDDPIIAKVTSSFVIYKTHLDDIDSYLLSGVTDLYAVGEYQDQLSIEKDRFLLVDRVVSLDTRELDIGSHKIF